MLELEEKAAASASAAQFERECSLRLEDDRGKLRSHLKQVKKEAALVCVGGGKQYVVVAIDTLPLHLPFE